MNKVKKLLISLFFISFILIIFYMNNMEVNADSTFTSKAKGFISAGGSGASGFSASSITSELVPIGQILTYIGAGVMVAATAYLGLQYIISPPDKQAALKEKLIGLVVAGVVIFGSYKIWSSVVGIFENM